MHMEGIHTSDLNYELLQKLVCDLIFLHKLHYAINNDFSLD